MTDIHQDLTLKIKTFHKDDFLSVRENGITKDLKK